VKKNNRLLRSDMFWGTAFLVLIALQFWWLPGEQGTSTDSYSNAIEGKLGLYRTLQQLFPAVTRDTQSLHPVLPATLLIIAPDRYPAEKEEESLYEYVVNGGTLLIAPRWGAPELKLSSLGIQVAPAVSPLDALLPPASLPAAPGTAPVSKPMQAESDAADQTTVPESTQNNQAAASDGPVQNSETDTTTNSPEASSSTGTPSTDTQSIATEPAATQEASTTDSEATAAGNQAAETDDAEDHGTEVLATSPLVNDVVAWRTQGDLVVPSFEHQVLVTADGNPAAATWELGEGRVLVCSSPDVFSNRSLLVPEQRRLAVRLVETIHDHHRVLGGSEPPIVLNEYLNASGAYQHTGVLLSPALRSGTLQLLAVAVLALWFGFHRFGPAAVVTTQRRRSLTDTAKAAGSLQYRLQDGGSVVAGYLDYVQTQLGRRYGPAVRLDRPETLAARTGLDPEVITRELRQAETLTKTSGVSHSQAAASVRWLAMLQKRLTGNQDS
jgi:hypothetical protein